MDREFWRALVHRFAKSQAQLRDWTELNLDSKSVSITTTGLLSRVRLWDPTDGSPPGSALRPVQLFTTPWTVAHQTPLSMGFSRQEYWSGLPFPSPGDLPDPEIEPGSPTLQADALTSEPPGKPLCRVSVNSTLNVWWCSTDKPSISWIFLMGGL